MKTPLGKLDPVQPKDYWDGEATEFTPWLAQPENLNLLGKTLDLGELELVGTEQKSGDFRADIIAKDVDGGIIIIENQLEKTNHDHLGKLITYGSIQGAKYVVWIAKHICDEHRKALDWLNNFTKEDVGFFGLEIELWKIGDSQPAPKFNVVSQPNMGAKAAAKAVGSDTTTQAEELRLSFWSGFVAYCKQEGTFLSLRKPSSDLWYSVAIGRANIHIALTFKVSLKVLGCELHFRNTRSKDDFEEFEKQKAAIEAELHSASALQWDSPIENGRRGRIAEFRTANLEDRRVWPELYAWLKERAEAFHKALSPRVKALKLETEEE